MKIGDVVKIGKITATIIDNVDGHWLSVAANGKQYMMFRWRWNKVAFIPK